MPQADPATGALVYSYPFTLPPGRSGLQPDLKLQYNSQQLDDQNVVGYGWSLSVPYIERLNKHGSDKIYTSTDFSSSLSGELVNVSGNQYAAKVESGDFLSYTYDGASWQVKDKRGTLYLFGQSTLSRQNDTTGTQTYRWLLSQVVDTNNNSVTYEYLKDSGQMYPSKVSYTGQGADLGIFSVNLTYETRPDAATSYRSGFQVITAKRLSLVEAKVSGTLVHRWSLNYTSGANGQRSLLNSITETGFDSTGVATSLPPMQFTYSTASTTNPIWQADPSWQVPTDVNFSRYGSQNNWRRVDINGDGLTDFVQAQGITNYNTGVTTYVQKTYLNTGTGWVTSNAWQLPLAAMQAWGRTYLIDLNGDSKLDLFIGRQPPIVDAQSQNQIFMNTGSGWQPSSWVVSSDPILPGIGDTSGDENRNSYGWVLLDVNGDSLPDLIEALRASDGTSTITRRALINTGNGWVEDATNFQTPPDIDLGIYNPSAGGSQVVTIDLNNDGLVDLFDFDKRVAFINTGKGWQQTTAFAIPVDPGLLAYYKACNPQATSTGTQGLRLIDVNNDGIADLERSGQYEITNCPSPTYQSLYRGSATDWLGPPGNAQLPADVLFYANEQQPEQKVFAFKFVDIDGDGSVDILTALTKPLTSETLREVRRYQGAKPDVLSRITYPTGGSTSVTYKASDQYKDQNGNLLNPNLPQNLQTVASLATSDGAGLTQNVSYTYAGGLYAYQSATDRKFAGFAKVTSTDSAGTTTTTFYHQGNSTNSAQGEYNDTFAKIGHSYRTEVGDSAGNLVNASITKWDSVDLGQGRSFVKPTQTLNFTYDGNTTHRDTAVTTTYDDTNGNVTQVTQWGEVQATDSGTFTDVGNDKLVTTTTYATGSGYGVTGLPASQVTNDQASTKVKEARLYYDTLALGSVGKGNITKQEQWVAGTTYVNTQKTYNPYGLVTQELDPRGKASTYVYDSYNLYPSTVTNALNQTTQYQYDYSAGKPTQVTDANGYVYQTVYDGLDRVVGEKQPDLTTPATLVSKTAYVYTDTPGSVSVKKTSYLDSATGVDAYTYFDGLGRPVQTRTEAETAGQFNAADTVYDARGLTQKQSLPYASSGSAKTAPTGASELYTTFTYDATGRPLTAVNSIGTTTSAYDDWKTTVTDARGNTTSRTQDAYGNLSYVTEPGGGTTTYTYNDAGNLTGMADAAGNVRSFTYDGLGQRLTAQDLHAPADTTFGAWAYTYDAAGNLTQKLDPKGQTINYTYDDLNRPLTEDYTGAPGTEVAYTYDACQNGKGRLCSVASAALTTTEQYDALRNTAREIKTINSSAYQTDYTYDRAGNMLTITNPDSSKVQYTYNTSGQLESVSRKEAADAGFASVVTNFDYGPTGSIVTQANANGTTTTNTYDAAKLYRLARKLTVNSGGTKLQDINYTYDAVGNITQTVNASQTNAAKTTVYTYDALNRLLTTTATGAANGQNYSQNFTYDAIGNMLTGPAGTYTYAGTGYANPHAVTSLGSATYSYDQNGNLVSDGVKTYTWDYANRLVRVDRPGPTPAPVTTTFYPAAGDGSASYQGASSWATTHDAATGTAATPTATTTNVSSGRGSGGKYQIERSFLPFDTSALPDNATITGARLKVFVASKLNDDNDNYDFVTVVQGLEPSTLSLTTADYSLAGTINTPAESVDAAERKDITSVATGAYLTFNVNNTGLGLVSKTGPTKLALREGHDVLNIPFAPSVATQTQAASSIKLAAVTGGGGSTSGYNQLQIRTSEYTGTTTDPILEVTYQLPAPIVSSTYAYDASGQRVTVTSGGVTTVYPSKTYNTDGTKKTKHIFAGDTMAATIETTGTTTTPHFIATDNLSGSNVVTSSTGTQEELTDYYPFGGIRLDDKATSYTEQRKYIGQEYDADTGLNYLNARYYNGTTGRFLSEDPMFWDNKQDVSNPQGLNSYSYSNDNPIIYNDPTGNRAEIVIKNLYPILGAHGFVNIIPDKGEDLSQYGSTDHFTIGGYSNGKPTGAPLTAQINNPGDLNVSPSRILATYPLTVPEGMTSTQYDQALLNAGTALTKQNLGTYTFTGRPISSNANSGNTWTQVVLDAGGAVPNIPNVYYGAGILGPKTPYFPLGSGHSLNTLSYSQRTGQSTRYAANQIVNNAISAAQATSTTAQYVGNAIGHAVNTVSSSVLNLNSLLLHSLIEYGH